MAQNIDWANVLEWGGGGGFKLPSEAEIAQSRANWDDFYSLTGKFSPQDQNIDLLRQLGFGGSAVDQQAGGYDVGGGSPRWSNEALQWLDGQGYSVGVGHQPGTKSGGRAEFWGLMGPDGKYVQGQSDPTMSMSDTLMDQVGMFAMLAGPFLNAAGVIGSGGGAGAAAGNGLAAAENIGSLAFESLGSIAPGVTASELAALSAALPEIGMAAGSGLGSVGGGLLGAGGAAASNVLPTVLTTGAAAGGSMLPGLLSGLAAGASALQPPPTAPQLPGNPQLDRVEIEGSRTPPPPNQPALPPLLPPGGTPQADYSNEGRNYSGPNGLDPSTNSPVNSGGTPPMIPDWLKSIGSGVGKVADVVGGGSNLAALIGAGLGATQGGGTQTSSRDPWAAAQPFLKNVLGDADNMLTQFRQNPLTAQQNNQFQHAFSGLDQARGALPGLLNWGQGAMQRQSTTPSYDQLFGGGLLGQQQPQQPTAQAGGPGGLLGNTQDDRMKALMARGRGLMG